MTIQFPNAWRPNPVESDYKVVEIDGEVPRELNGTLYRNGPNQNVLPSGGSKALHFLEGDGMVNAFFFEDGEVYHRSRYVEARGFLREKEVGQYLGGFQNPPEFDDPSGIPMIKPNTNAVFHGGRLLAMIEHVPPFEIDPDTLAPKGFWNLDGKMLGLSTTAHPKIDGATGAMVIHGYQPFEPYLTVYQIEADGTVSRADKYDPPHVTFMHDVAITENFIILPLNAIALNLDERSASGVGGYEYGDYLTLKFGITKREPGAKMRWFDTGETGAIFHVGNAYEQDEKIHLDACTYSQPKRLMDNLTTARRGKVTGGIIANPVLYDFDLRDGSAKSTKLSDMSAEFPRVDDRLVGHRNEFGYCTIATDGNGTESSSQIARYSRDGGPKMRTSHQEGEFVGEPIFVPRAVGSSEEDGFILHQRYHSDGDRSSLDILDAKNVDQEPLARLWLQNRFPIGFHGNWVGN